MARMHGMHGQVQLTDSPEVTLAALNSWTLDQTRDLVDVTSFGDTNKTYVVGLSDLKGTLGGFYDPGDGSPATGGNAEDFFGAAEGDTPVNLKLMPSTLLTTVYWTGPAYLNGATINVSATGAITITGGFAASGAWTRNS
jgi:hypothetical protein